jgi:hypothetical protein
MILTSLKNSVCPKARAKVGGWLTLALFTALLGGLSHWYARRLPAEFVRPLSIEERETIVTLFAPIDVRLPQIHDWSRHFYGEFEASRLIPLVDFRLPSETLARLDGNRVHFSPKFFEADPMTQESWLVQLMAQAMPDHAAELAVRPGDETTSVGGIE